MRRLMSPGPSALRYSRRRHYPPKRQRCIYLPSQLRYETPYLEQSSGGPRKRAKEGASDENA
jgi:hypothetical protein